jgi:hypothetical protein
VGGCYTEIEGEYAGIAFWSTGTGNLTVSSRRIYECPTVAEVITSLRGFATELLYDISPRCYESSYHPQADLVGLSVSERPGERKFVAVLEYNDLDSGFDELMASPSRHTDGPAIRFRSDDIVRHASGEISSWPAVAPGGLEFAMTVPADPGVEYGAAPAQPMYNEEGTYSEDGSGGEGLAGAKFDRESTDMAMYSNWKVAIGAHNTFFALVTPDSNALAFGSIIGFRPDEALGTFAWVIGSFAGCPHVPCLFVDDWRPSGYRGEWVEAGVTQLVIVRSRKEDTRPASEFAMVRGGTDTVAELTWTSTMFSDGLEEYDDVVDETFDLDLRDPVIDGLHCFAAGYMILGNWQNRGDMQFRGTIHHIELYPTTLSNAQVSTTVAEIYGAHPALQGATFPWVHGDCPLSGCDIVLPESTELDPSTGYVIPFPGHVEVNNQPVEQVRVQLRPDRAPGATVMNGEEYCEQHIGADETLCLAAAACCEWDGQTCWSSIGNNECPQAHEGRSIEGAMRFSLMMMSFSTDVQADWTPDHTGDDYPWVGNTKVRARSMRSEVISFVRSDLFGLAEYATSPEIPSGVGYCIPSSLFEESQEDTEQIANDVAYMDARAEGDNGSEASPTIGLHGLTRADLTPGLGTYPNGQPPSIPAPASPWGGGPTAYRFTTPGTWEFVVPHGVTSVHVQAWGGGGGGGAGNGEWATGGGGGGYATAEVPVEPGETIELVVGAGGLGSIKNGQPCGGNGGDGEAGGSSSFGTEVVANGGGAGGARSGGYAGGVGGTGVVSANAVDGSTQSGQNGQGGTGQGGYGGAAAGENEGGGAGGDMVTTSTEGNDGVAPGGAGGGGVNCQGGHPGGGNGAAGTVVVLVHGRTCGHVAARETKSEVSLTAGGAISREQAVQVFSSQATSALNRPASTAEFRTPGTWQYEVPYGVTSVHVQAWGGGGGGGAGNGAWATGGGGGGYVTAEVPVEPGETIELVVGAGGLGSIKNGQPCGGNGGDGEAGGSSSFGADLLVAEGGSFGGAQGGDYAGGVGGTGLASTDVIHGIVDSGQTGQGGTGQGGYGGAAGGENEGGGAGGDTVPNYTEGNDGIAPGGAGGGGPSCQNGHAGGGNGAAGAVIVSTRARTASGQNVHVDVLHFLTTASSSFKIHETTLLSALDADEEFQSAFVAGARDSILGKHFALVWRHAHTSTLFHCSLTRVCVAFVRTGIVLRYRRSHCRARCRHP